MAVNGRTIRIFLTEGMPDGVLTAEIMNWTGKVTIGPKSQLADLARREEVQRTGVYILAGDDPGNPSKERVYIGEGDNVLRRLMRHYRASQKDFWVRTAVITSKDSNLTKAHVRYLESQLIGLAVTAGRAVLDNATTPPPPDLPEADCADMESFLEQVVMLLPVLGFSFAVQTPSSLAPACRNSISCQSPYVCCVP